MPERPMNLDLMAMGKANSILGLGSDAEDLDTLATKGLGVVTEQGIYAGLLFFYCKNGRRFTKELMELARAVVTPSSALEPENRLGCLRYLAEEVCVDLHSTLLVKALWEQTLTYVRYGAKAQEKANG